MRTWLARGALLILSAGLVDAAFAQQCQDNSRVVVGVPADIKDHPWQVAIDTSVVACVVARSSPRTGC
jgi:hypothetical protein